MRALQLLEQLGADLWCIRCSVWIRWVRALVSGGLGITLRTWMETLSSGCLCVLTCAGAGQRRGAVRQYRAAGPNAGEWAVISDYLHADVAVHLLGEQQRDCLLVPVRQGGNAVASAGAKLDQMHALSGLRSQFCFGNTGQPGLLIRLGFDSWMTQIYSVRVAPG